MNVHSINYGHHEIEFSIVYTERKSIETRVYPDLSLEVRAPTNTELDEVEKIIRKRAAWILKQKKYFSNFLPETPQRLYISGETHKYMGRQYRLKIVPDPQNSVTLKGKYVIMRTLNDDTSYREKLLYEWYRQKAEKKFVEILENLIGPLEKYGLVRPEIKIKKMKRRWGSCNTKKMMITLNIDLIKAPSQCIEYVIMHELCHIKNPFHDNDYYNFLSLVMPDWKERKARLKEVHLA